MTGRISPHLSDLPTKQTPGGTVGLLLLRSYVLGKDANHYDGVIRAMEARGLNVIPAFAGGLDARPVLDELFMKDGKTTVDAVVNLTGFSLVGGPAYNDAKAAEEALARLDRPYIAAHPVEFQTLQAWGANKQGLLPLESTIMIAIPELDGGTTPMVFGGRSDGSDAACTGCSAAAPGRSAALSAPCRAAPNAPKRWQRAWTSWSRCAGRTKPSAVSASCCSTSRRMAAPLAPRSSSPCSNRCTKR